MEVYAAAVAQSDYEIGRVIDSLRDSGQLDNTLVIYIEGDNGASAEGTLQGTTNEMGQAAPEHHYPVGWALAMDTPFQWTKQVASHFGGTRNGMCLSWPNRISSRGEVRSQFHHVIDIVPTILEEVGVQAPLVLTARHKCRWRDQHGLHVRGGKGRAPALDTVFRNRSEPWALPRRLDRQHDAATTAVGRVGRRA